MRTSDLAPICRQLVAVLFYSFEFQDSKVYVLFFYDVCFLLTWSHSAACQVTDRLSSIQHDLPLMLRKVKFPGAFDKCYYITLRGACPSPCADLMQIGHFLHVLDNKHPAVCHTFGCTHVFEWGSKHRSKFIVFLDALRDSLTGVVHEHTGSSTSRSHTSICWSTGSASRAGWSH